MAASVNNSKISYVSPGGQIRTMICRHAVGAYQSSDNKKLHVEYKNGGNQWTEVYEIPQSSSPPKLISTSK